MNIPHDKDSSRTELFENAGNLSIDPLLLVVLLEFFLHLLQRFSGDTYAGYEWNRNIAVVWNQELFERPIHIHGLQGSFPTLGALVEFFKLDQNMRLFDVFPVPLTNPSDCLIKSKTADPDLFHNGQIYFSRRIHSHADIKLWIKNMSDIELVIGF